MQYNELTNRTGMLQDVEDLCNLAAQDISANTVLKQTITRYMNNWYFKAIAWILEAQGSWEWDDTNYSDFPIATTNLVASQEDYQLPASQDGDDESTFLKLIRVEVRDSNGDFKRLDWIDDSQYRTAESEFHKTDGLPTYYREIAGSIKIFPAPSAASTTLTNGLKVYFQRTADAFTTSDDSQEPGIAAPFHRVITYGAAYDYCVMKQKTAEAQIYRAELEQLKNHMLTFYGRRNMDTKVRVSPRRERYS